MPCYVIGHRNPDTDAICSAIGYASFLQKTRLPEATPARCGDLNARTSWVLEKAGMPAPRLLMDVRPTAGAVCQKGVTTAHPDETFLTVYQRMMEGGFRSVPVIDNEGTVLGMPTMREILSLLLPDEANQMHAGARTVRTSLENMTRVLRGRLVHAREPELEQDLIMSVAASSWETLRDRTKQFPANQSVFIMGDRPSLQRLGIDEGIRALVLTGGFELIPEDLERARENGVSIIYCDHDTATTTQLIRCSRRVGSSQFEKFLSFPPGALVSYIRKQAQEEPGQALFPVLEDGCGKLIGVISRTDLLSPPRTRLVLVDHNEFSQAVKGADEAEVIEVIDHHRLSGNLVTKEPVRFINDPLGSTCTIVARMFRDLGLKPEKNVATCMCAGIISDTLKLTSPTTTEVDREILPWLAEIAEIDVDDFAQNFFGAGSVLKHQPASEALESDRKEYEEGGFKISISQIEELGLRQFEEQRRALADELEALRHRQGLDFACLMVTDITKNNSVLLVAGDNRLADRIEYPRIGQRLFQLDGVVSRKKQLFPALSRVLASLDGTPEPEEEVAVGAGVEG